MPTLTVNSTLDDFRTHVDTPKRRYAFQCFASTFYATENTLFVALVEGFRTAAKRRKAQVVLLQNYFIDGDRPDFYRGFIEPINIDGNQADGVRASTTNILGLRTFKDKRAQLGFVGALRGMGGRTMPGADLFDVTQSLIWTLLKQDIIKNGFDPDGNYDANPKFSAVMGRFKAEVTAAGWDAEA